MYVHVYVYAYAYVYVYVYCLCVCVHCMRMDMYMYMHMHAYVYVYIRTSIYTRERERDSVNNSNLKRSCQNELCAALVAKNCGRSVKDSEDRHGRTPKGPLWRKEGQQNIWLNNNGRNSRRFVGVYDTQRNTNQAGYTCMQEKKTERTMYKTTEKHTTGGGGEGGGGWGERGRNLEDPWKV